MFVLLITAALAGDPDWTSLTSDSGWTQVATPETDETGPIDLRTKKIAGVDCLRGVVTVPHSPDTIYAVVTDVPAAKRFSSEKLIEAKVLGTKGTEVDYYQHLDVPNWTMAADRYWVLRGGPAHQGTTKVFRWWRFDWRSAYPDLATSIDTEHPDALEPQTNWGSWVLAPEGEGTKASYYICSDAGGSLPGWVQKAAATKTLPNTMADVMREAGRR